MLGLCENRSAKTQKVPKRQQPQQQQQEGEEASKKRREEKSKKAKKKKILKSLSCLTYGLQIKQKPTASPSVTLGSTRAQRRLRNIAMERA